MAQVDKEVWIEAPIEKIFSYGSFKIKGGVQSEAGIGGEPLPCLHWRWLLTRRVTFQPGNRAMATGEGFFVACP